MKSFLTFLTVSTALVLLQACTTVVEKPATRTVTTTEETVVRRPSGVTEETVVRRTPRTTTTETEVRRY